jgi:hypothetical protein
MWGANMTVRKEVQLQLLEKGNTKKIAHCPPAYGGVEKCLPAIPKYLGQI